MLEIRPITRDDEAEWRRLWTDYLTYYESSVSEDVYASSFERLLSDDPHEYIGHLAIKDGTPVGLVHFLFHRHGWHIQNVVYLQDLYVSQAARGTGAGRALIQSVYDAADTAGCPNVYWLTQEHNATARSLYDRMADVTPFIKYQRGVK